MNQLSTPHPIAYKNLCSMTAFESMVNEYISTNKAITTFKTQDKAKAIHGLCRLYKNAIPLEHVIESINKEYSGTVFIDIEETDTFFNVKEVRVWL